MEAEAFERGAMPEVYYSSGKGTGWVAISKSRIRLMESVRNAIHSGDCFRANGRMELTCDNSIKNKRTTRKGLCTTTPIVNSVCNLAVHDPIRIVASYISTHNGLSAA